MLTKKATDDFMWSWQELLHTCHDQQMYMVDTFFKGMEQTTPFSLPLSAAPHLNDIFVKATQALARDPSSFLKAQEELLEEMNTLLQKIVSATPETLDPSSDKRFRHQAWETVPYFVFIKEHYLIMSRWAEKIVAQLDDLDEVTTKKIQFYTKQLVDAASPTNSPFTNPEVLEEFVKTKGESLRKGLETLLQDLEAGQWMKMTDPSAFQLGETLATTKGEIVYRNHLFELIHYAPLTKKQYATPLLIVPAWVNKYYIFDLSRDNSFVKWLVEQGHNVFIISWVNPQADLASMTFEDYLFDGAYRACEVVSSLTHSPILHTMGYCIGGNLLTALSAYLAKNTSPFSLQTMTLLATIIDFDKTGDLKIFMDEEHLKEVEKVMGQHGFLNGENLKSLFSLLRPNDLIWSFFIKNYFLGQVPPAFDFLYWNSDSIRLPAGLHQFVLRKFFQKNLFMKPGEITVRGTSLDVRNITTPTFLLSTLEDHISPWQSTYPATQLFRGPLKFILAGSGHVAGVINPPSKNKYGFFTNSYFPDNAEKWFKESTKNKGSWWTAWHNWVVSFNQEKILSLRDFPFLGAAPGSYVRMV